jgi:hypothetical protein
VTNKTKVKNDNFGLFVRAGGYIFRPGEVASFVRGDVTDGGLNAGDEVRAHHIAGTTISKITLVDGRVLYWHNEYQHKMEAERKTYLAACEASGIDPTANILKFFEDKQPVIRMMKA